MFFKRSIQEHSWMLLFFALTIGFVFASELAGGVWIKRDLHRHFIPLWSFGIETLQSGRIPFWNPYVLSGHPFFASLQTCVFYPPTLLLHWTGVVEGLNAYIVAHLILAAWGTCVWMRAWGAGRAGSAVSGLAYALAGSMLSAINAPINLAASAWFPFCMLALRGALSGQGGAPVAGLALALSMMFLAGDPSVVHAASAVFAFYCAARFASPLLRGARPDVRALARPAAGAALFAGLVAFQLLPFVDYVFKTERISMSAAESTMWSVPPSDAAGLLIPFWNDLRRPLADYAVRQSFFDNLYAGGAVAVLAFSALAGGWCTDRRVRLTALLAAFGLLLVMGRNTPFYSIYSEIVPAAKSIRYPVRFFFLVNFAFACLAGLGLDAALRARRENLRFLRGGIPAAGAAACTAAAAGVWYWKRSGAAAWLGKFAAEAAADEKRRADFVDIGLATMHNAVFAAAVAAAAFGILFLLARRSIPAKWAALAMAALVFFDLKSTNAGFEPYMNAGEFRRETPNVSFLKKQEGLWRVAPSPAVLYKYSVNDPPTMNEIVIHGRDRLVTNMNVYHRIAQVTGYDSQYTPDEVDFLKAYAAMKDPTQSSLLDAVNARFVIVDAGHEAAVAGRYRLAHRGQAADIYENPDAMPRAFVADAAALRSDNREIIRELAERKTDLGKTVYLHVPAGTAPPPERPGVALDSSKKATVLSYGDDRVEIEVETEGGGWLCLADAYESNWRASIDGRRTSIYKANGLLRAVYVSPGKHRVIFEYRNIAFFAGLAISALSGLAILALLTVRKRL